jgi:hypothetical protein
MNGTLILGILLVFGIVGLIVYAVGLYNTLVRLSNNIDKAWYETRKRHAGRRHQCPNRL